MTTTIAAPTPAERTAQNCRTFWSGPTKRVTAAEQFVRVALHEAPRVAPRRIGFLAPEPYQRRHDLTLVTLSADLTQFSPVQAGFDGYLENEHGLGCPIYVVYGYGVPGVDGNRIAFHVSGQHEAVRVTFTSDCLAVAAEMMDRHFDRRARRLAVAQ